MYAVTHSDPKMSFFHVRLSVCASVCTFVHLWSSKVLNLPVCLSTSSGLVKLRLFVSIPGKCYVKNKRTTKNMTLQEDACLVASFIQMNAFCVQDLQTWPQKTTLNIRNMWMPKILSSEVASRRRPVEEGNGHGVWSQGFFFFLALPPAKMYFWFIMHER